MTNETRITVDDVLISTDVDKLIKALEGHKKLSITDLQRITGMERRTIEKWIEALEEEGYVRIEHKITDRTITWLNDENIVHTIQQDGKSINEDTITPKPPREIKNIPNFNVDSELKSLDERDSDEKDEVEERVSKLEKKLREDELSSESTIRNESGDNEEKTDEIFRVIPLPLQEESKEENDIEKIEINRNQKQTDLVRSIKDKIVQREYEVDKKKSKVRQTINKYIDEIQRQKREIENLKREKERLYHEDYLSIESKAEADIAILTEKILAKEERLLDLKERIVELPVKIDEIEKMQRSIAQIEQEGKRTVNNVVSRVNKFLEDVKKTERALTVKIDEGKNAIETSRNKLAEISELGIIVTKRIEEIRARVTDTEMQVDELNKTMKDMLTDIEEATEMKVEISEIENRIHGAVDRKEEELDMLVSELEEIKNLEEWVKEYVRNYEQKVEEIEDYAKSSESELDELREQAEANHLKRYLSTLDTLTKDYQAEVEGVIDTQKSVDKKIEDAKVKLNNLLTESQNLIKKIQSDAENVKDFEIGVSKVRESISKVKKTVEEKEKERDRLKEDISKVKKKRKEKREKKKRR